jgi:deazaflavin-dependent oxidoreductase (nitroreductase family)
MTALFDPALVQSIARNQEVDLTTFGRVTEKPSRRTIWITTDGQRLYVRSRLGFQRDWPRNLRANGRGILHVDGQNVPVRARLVTDPAEARAAEAATIQKYAVDRQPSRGDEPLTLSELSTFELCPAEVTP